MEALALAVNDDSPLLHEVSGELAQLLAALDAADVDPETGEAAGAVSLLSRIEELRLSLPDAVDAVLARVEARMLRADAIDLVATRLHERSERLRKRAERDAEQVRQALIATGTKKLAGQHYEPTLRDGGVQVEVVDEVAVPVTYKREPPPPPEVPPPERWAVDKTLAGAVLREHAAKTPKGTVAPAGVVPGTEGVIPGLRLVRGEPKLVLK